MSPEDLQKGALESTMVSLGSKSMGGGTVASIIGYMSSNGFAVLIGVLVTIFGFFCSVYFQRRSHVRNREKWELEKEQMIAEEKRREEIHQLKLRRLSLDAEE